MRELSSSAVRKRSITNHGRQTSVSMENEFWDIFRAVARERNMTMGKLYEAYKRTCPENSTMASHIRTSILHLVIERTLSG